MLRTARIAALTAILLATAAHAGESQTPPGSAPAESARDEAQARLEGAAAADRVHPWGWFGRGLLGGALGGPIGTAIAYRKADQNPLQPLAAEDVVSAPGPTPLYLEHYRAGFESRLRSRRKGYALIGGAIGTGVLAFTLLQLFDVGDRGRGTLPPPTETPGYSPLPVRGR